MSLSLLTSNVKVTGSNVVYNANFTGIGGAQVFISGNQIFISGGAGGTAGTGGGITQGQLDALSGFTTGISGALQTQISSSSAGVSNINGSSGALNLIGGGGVQISSSGQTIYITGKNLATSGDITGLSGWTNNTFSTIVTTNLISGNLIQTGIQLTNAINSLSGYVDNTLVHRTGNELISGAKRFQISSSSGFYISSGARTLLSVTPTSTIISLVNGNSVFDSAQTLLWDTSFNPSIDWNSRYAQDINAAIVLDWANKFLADASGFTSVSWQNRKLSIGGAATTVLDWGTREILGEWITTTTGIQSGSLVNFYRISGLSGVLVSNFTALNTGLSGYLVSLIGASAAGVASINGASGVLTIGGAPLSNVTVTTNGQNIIVSGNTGDYAFFAQKTDVTQTGIQLINRDFLISGILTTGLTNTGVLLNTSIVSLSGFVGNVSGGLQSQVNTKTAITTTDLISGNLIQTGIQLRNNDFLISGILTTGLTNTGVLLGTSIGSLSGFVGNVSGGLQAQITVSQLDVTGSSNILNPNFTGAGNVSVFRSGNSIIFISGDTSLLATVANLTATGVALINRDNSIGATLSGNLTQTGIDLIARLNSIGASLSGNLTSTGVQLGNSINALSGFVGNVSGGLQAQITAGGGATVNNLYLTGSNLYILITGLSGLKTPSNLSYTSNSFNFIVTQPITSYFYTWSGLLPTGTGFLPAASTASGMDFTIKNKVITGNRLLISGNIDNLQNLLVYSLDSYTFKSDGQTWNIV